jgi:hypothetical protein
VTSTHCAWAETNHVGEPEGGSADVEDGGCLVEAESAGHGDECLRRDRDPLRVPAVTRVGDDPVADPGRVDTLTCGSHVSGDAGARHVWRLHREPIAPPSAPDLCLDEQHRRDGDVDHRLTRPGDRLRRFDRHEHLRISEASDLYDAHRHHPPFVITAS